MKYNQLPSASKKARTRVGRGISAGKGKTAGRGTKGQNSRAGARGRIGFEGGQNPLAQRIPKLRGFTSRRTKPVTLSTSKLELVKSSKVDNFTLYSAKLVDSPFTTIRLVNGAKLTKKLNVTLQGASKNAITAVEKAGGTFKLSPKPHKQKRTTKE